MPVLLEDFDSAKDSDTRTAVRGDSPLSLTIVVASIMDVIRGTKAINVTHRFNKHMQTVCKSRLVGTHRIGIVRFATQRSMVFVANGAWSCDKRAEASSSRQCN